MRKGITPVVAVVMLTTITLAAAGSVWTMYENIQRQAPEEGPDIRITNLNVEECWTEPGKTFLMMRNGNPDAVDTQHINVYLNGSLEDSATFHTGSSSVVSSQASFRLEIDQKLTRATEIKIATERNSIDFRC